MNQTDIKKYICIFVIVVFILLNVISTRALDYSINYSCEKNQCISGEVAEWDISITNYGDRGIEIVSIELRDSINNTLIAFFNTTYNPTRWEIGDLFVIPHNQQKTKTIKTKLPKPNNYSTLVYYACFTNTVDAPEYEKLNIYSLRYCYDEKNEVMPVLECVLNSSCSYNEYCRNNKCVKFKCKECQYISFHKCIDYECCDNSACKKDELCTNNNCVKLKCNEDEYPFNHSCKILNCSYNEAFINHSCKTLNCSEDEFVFNHSCLRLNCSEDEFVFNRSCLRLNCSEDEFSFNHSCIKLGCMFNETGINHTCKPLNCYFFQKIVNHLCVNDKQLMFKLSIELVVILIIISLLIIDVRRYMSKGKGEKDKGTEQKYLGKEVAKTEVKEEKSLLGKVKQKLKLKGNEEEAVKPEGKEEVKEGVKPVEKQEEKPMEEGKKLEEGEQDLNLKNKDQKKGIEEEAVKQEGKEEPIVLYPKLQGNLEVPNSSSASEKMLRNQRFLAHRKGVSEPLKQSFGNEVSKPFRKNKVFSKSLRRAQTKEAEKQGEKKTEEISDGLPPLKEKEPKKEEKKQKKEKSQIKKVEVKSKEKKSTKQKNLKKREKKKA